MQANAVDCSTWFGTMGFVAIAAGNSGREHLALLERPVIVDLIKHLPVGVIESASEGRNNVGVPKIRRAAHGTGRRSRPPCA